MRNIDFNKYQSALIIGNGFDLSLGLSTSYMDFVNSDEFQILLNMQIKNFGSFIIKKMATTV